MTTPTGKFPSSSRRVTEKQIYHHASEMVRSTSPAGGLIPRSQYENKVPRTQSGGSNLNKPLNEVPR